MQLAAKENEKIVFLIEDFQLVDERFLQYINAIIASGNMPGLYSAQEFEQIASFLRNSAFQGSFTGNNINSYFSQSCFWLINYFNK